MLPRKKLTMFFSAILLPIAFSSQLRATPWTNPQPSQTFFYMYGPGMMWPDTQMAKLCPKFIGQTGEEITCSRGSETIQPQVQSCQFAEVNLQSRQETQKFFKRLGIAALVTPFLWLAHSTLKKPYARLLTGVTIPSLALYTCWPQLNFLFFKKLHNDFDIKIATQESNHSHTLAGHYINPCAINIGQDQDIALYKKMVDDHHTQHPGDKLVLYGVSRGAATVFNFCMQHDSDSIAALVCEGVFDSLHNLAQHGNLLAKTKLFLLSKLNITNFKADGIFPLTSLAHTTCDKNKPIALITSKADEVVPVQCTLNLYRTLQEQGFTNVHILILSTSTHNVYATGAEKEIYQGFMHAFYKRYNLPYIEAYAQHGEPYFRNSQPNRENLIAFY